MYTIPLVYFFAVGFDVVSSLAPPSVLTRISLEPERKLSPRSHRWGWGWAWMTGQPEDVNPLLREGDLPDFAHVLPEHMRPAVRSRLVDSRARFHELEQAIEARSSPPAYEDVMLPLQILDQYAGAPWRMIRHLESVLMSDALGEAVEELTPEVTSFWQDAGQSQIIYNALLQVQNSDGYSELPEAQRRSLDNELRSRRLAGVELSASEAAEFNQLQQDLTRLSSEYSNNVLHSARVWSLLLTDQAAVEGIPRRTLEAAASEAIEDHPDATAEDGPWLFRQDATVLGPALTYAANATIREQLFRAMVAEASEAPYDNTETIGGILSKRQRLAALLGFQNFAEQSLASKMAERQQVHDLLDELKATARPAAAADDEELRTFARSEGEENLQLWDRSFYVNRLQTHRFDIDAEALRVYFPFPAVAQGLFDFARSHYDVEVELDESEAASRVLWHQDARLYTVKVNGTARGHLIIDPFSRPGQKRSGAWMSAQFDRNNLGDSLQMPLACVVTNFPAPQGGQPSLLALGEARTLFHEFGHALQHLLTVQNEPYVSGINGIEWDAVEVASQFHEYFVDHDRGTLYSFARHHETGEPLPDELYQKLQDALHFRAGSSLLGQVHLGLVDLRLHESFEDGEDVHGIERNMALQTLITEPLPEARPLCSFSHIFAGGYAAGYYSYQWSKVLSADAFSAFDEAGLDNPERQLALGRHWASTALAMGGGRAPADVFRDFRGRAFQSGAMLRYSGLTVPSN